MNDQWHYETKRYLFGIEITWGSVAAVALGILTVAALAILLSLWMQKGS
jgi:hypothetical protein